MYDLDSLYARVLRAKYYPDGKLLQAKLKSGVLLLGRVCLQALDVLSEAIYGVLEMVHKLTYEMIAGFLKPQLESVNSKM